MVACEQLQLQVPLAPLAVDASPGRGPKAPEIEGRRG